MTTLTRKLPLAICLVTGLTTAAQAQFSFFPYISGPSQPTANSVVENRSVATAPAVQPSQRREQKSNKKVLTH